MQKPSMILATLAIICCAAIAISAESAGPAVAQSAMQNSSAQNGAHSAAFPPQLRQFIKVDAPTIVLQHVTVIDGTGAAPQTDQAIVISDGKISAVGPAASVIGPAGARVMDLTGYTVIPGLVGMHEHLFYPAGGPVPMYNELSSSAPRMYLACGVTSARTTGSIEPYTDLNLKRMIDENRIIGPKLNVTGPYLEGAGAYTPQMHELANAAEARKVVDYWSDLGAGSFKAYMHITHDELAAAIDEAHKRGVKLTGHLCSVGFQEAAGIGIDNLEHGLVVDTEFDPSKKPDGCPSQTETYDTLAKMDVEGPEIQKTIHELIAHRVAVTSTLAIFETFVPNRPPLETRVMDMLLPQERISYLERRASIAGDTTSPWNTLLKTEMQFERDFVKQGGVLLAGVDPTGYGGDLAGFGDQREAELLVEAGFSVPEAIRIYTMNAAQFLGTADKVGSIAPGKAADLVVIHGDLPARIADIEKAEVVFKDGIGYDSQKLLDSVKGTSGLH
jgi:imidazolonepropionase-like amidohydrolase